MSSIQNIKIIIVKSPVNIKRARAIITNLDTNEIRKVDFGSKSKQTFYDGADETKRKNYLIRHKGQGNQDWNDVYTAGFWSRYLFWQHHKRDLLKIIKDIKANAKNVNISKITFGADFK